MRGSSLLPALLSAVLAVAVAAPDGRFSWPKRQLPQDPTGVQHLTTANNVQIRYKEPGKHGVCETTPGVRSFSGYVDTAPDEHTFFYFFEARRDAANAPVTVWLNGGPGSDSLIGLYEGGWVPVFTG